MAVVKAMHRQRGRAQWILFYADADTLEVVTEDGVIDPQATHVDFVASYYVEAEAPLFGDVMVRVAEATDAPVGVMLENVSVRRSRGVWDRIRGRRGESQLALVGHLLDLAQGFPTMRQLTLLPIEPGDLVVLEEEYGVTFAQQHGARRNAIHAAQRGRAGRNPDPDS